MTHIDRNEVQTENKVSASTIDGKGKKVNLDADALLQASRRLDWRFLLPDPDLGHVAYLGAVPDDFVDSLQLFSLSVSSLSPITEQEEQVGQFDLIIVQNLSGENLQLAAKRLKPGGYLYAENKGLSSPKLRYARGGHRQFAIPKSCVTAVSQMGFTEVEAHWHWPNFGACTKIIPLNDEGALWFSFVRGGRSVKARLRSSFGRWLLRSGLLAKIVPEFSIIARLNNS